MTNRFCAILGALAIAFSVAAAPLVASAESDPTTAVTKQTSHHKRHVAKAAHESSRSAYYRSLEPYRSFGFKGDYPGDCARQRAAGQCMIDLGYGRCVSCDQGGGGGWQ